MIPKINLDRFFFSVLFYLSAFHFSLVAQISDLDSISIDLFKKYDIFFIGEQHNVSSTDSVEALLVSKLVTNKTKVLLEVGYDKNSVFNTFLKRDTTSGDFRQPVNSFDNRLLKFLFSSKNKAKAIDVPQINDFSKELIVKAYFKDKPMPDIVKSDIEEFLKIGAMRPPRTTRNMNKYDKFFQHFSKNKRLHNSFLGSDSCAIDEYFDALNASIESACDSKANGTVFSNLREEFLFKMVRTEIEKDSTKTIISINGSAHIFLDPLAQLKWIKNREWTPLAYKIKITYPNKKICSIYLLSIENDFYFKRDFPEEMKYIKASTIRGKNYLIPLNDTNLPFKDLANKFTYIIAY